jgi:hypothetical protein
MLGMRKDYRDEEMFSDPDPSSDNESPEFIDKVFQMYEATNTKPETIGDPKERKRYRKRLEKNSKNKSPS